MSAIHLSPIYMSEGNCCLCRRFTTPYIHFTHSPAQHLSISHHQTVKTILLYCIYHRVLTAHTALSAGLSLEQYMGWRIFVQPTTERARHVRDIDSMLYPSPLSPFSSLSSHDDPSLRPLHLAPFLLSAITHLSLPSRVICPQERVYSAGSSRRSYLLLSVSFWLPS